MKVDDQRVCFGTPLDPENGLEGLVVVGIGAQSVDGLRGKSDQSAFPKDVDRLSDEGGIHLGTGL